MHDHGKSSHIKKIAEKAVTSLLRIEEIGRKWSRQPFANLDPFAGPSDHQVGSLRLSDAFAAVLRLSLARSGRMLGVGDRAASRACSLTFDATKIAFTLSTTLVREKR